MKTFQDKITVITCGNSRVGYATAKNCITIEPTWS